MMVNIICEVNEVKLINVKYNNIMNEEIVKENNHIHRINDNINFIKLSL